MKEVKLISDQAIGEGDGGRIDGLGFETYASILARAAAETEGPFTIGVFGEWGTGKTTLLRLIHEKLKNDINILPIWFNAWRYEKENHPIVPLIATIIKGLRAEKSFLEKLTDGGKTLIKGLRAIAYGFSMKASLNLPLVGGVEASGKIKDMLDQMEKIETDPLLENSLYYDAFEILNNIKIKSGTKIVIIIDDLDRCFPEKAVRLLETIKLVLAQPGFIIILGVARSVIEGYLEYRYKREYGITELAGQAYLDKIVQMPFHIPPHDRRMDSFCKMLIGQVEDSYKEIFEEVLPILGSACANNPRTTIRFVNNLLIDCAIFKELIQAADDTIPIGSFAIGRSLQLRWIKIYKLLIGSDALCQAILDWDVQTKFQKALKSDDEDISFLANEIKSDSHLDALVYSVYGRNWLTDNKLRITTTQFLETQEEEEEEEEKKEKAKPKAPRKKPAARKKTAAKIAPAKKKPAKKKTVKRKPNPAFMKPMTPSDDLAKIVGNKSLSRTEITKKLWAYIKKNNLQDSQNNRIIITDAKLKKLFGNKKKVNMFEMTKLISTHLK